MRFKKDAKAWNDLTRSRTGLVGQHLQRLVNRLESLARRQVGVDTGKLRKSIFSNIRIDAKGLIGTVGANDRIAMIHHQGTRPHIIVPNRKQTLRFSARGKIVYTKLVHHPGTKPNRFLTDNLRKVIDD